MIPMPLIPHGLEYNLQDILLSVDCRYSCPTKPPQLSLRKMWKLETWPLAGSLLLLQESAAELTNAFIKYVVSKVTKSVAMAVSNQARSPRAIFCSRATVLAAGWCTSHTSYNGCWPPITTHDMSPRQRRATQNFSLSQSTDSSVQQHGSQTANRASQSTNCYFDSFSHHQHQTQIVMNFSGNTILLTSNGHRIPTRSRSRAMRPEKRMGNRKTAHITSLPRKWCKGLWWLHDHPWIQVPNNHGPPLQGGFNRKLSASMAFMTAVRWRLGKLSPSADSSQATTMDTTCKVRSLGEEASTNHHYKSSWHWP